MISTDLKTNINFPFNLYSHLVILIIFTCRAGNGKKLNDFSKVLKLHWNPVCLMLNLTVSKYWVTFHKGPMTVQGKTYMPFFLKIDLFFY